MRYAPGNANRKLSVRVSGKQQSAGRDRLGKLAFGASPKEAPVVHFAGPLTLDLFWDQEPLLSGADNEITAVLGTPGVGPGTFAQFYCDAYPHGAWPTAFVEFPPANGETPVTKTIRLEEE